MRPEKLILLATAQTVGFDGVFGSGGEAEWTLDDLGMALQGLEPLYFAAFAFRWAADDGGRKVLREELLREAEKISKREKWPEKIAGKEYISRLVDLVFLEDRNPSVFRVSVLWPTIMDVDPGVWEKVLSKKYEAIRAMYDSWVSIAHTHMNDKLRACEFDCGK